MKKNILIVGNGGREYAMGRVLKADSRVEHLYFAPGNGGTSQLGINIPHTQPHEILESIRQHQIHLVVIGPEVPLSEGLSDFLRQHQIPVFGPSQKASVLESSKSFMKQLVSSINVPTARYLYSKLQAELDVFIESLTPPIVVKADGLCAGKGVVIAQSVQEAKEVAQSMLTNQPDQCVVIEEFLDGYELSVFAICDGEDFILLPACQDHKRLLSGDNGPNTGGMGAYTPTPLCDEILLEKIKTSIITPTMQEMKARGMPFEGVLFAGIMVCEKNGQIEPFLLEFNVRFGDPECEVLMPLLDTPLLDIITHTLEKNIINLACRFKNQYAVAVVASSKDYPYRSSLPTPITINDFDESLGHIAYAGVSVDDNGRLLASGGRVLLAVGVDRNIAKARDNAYEILKSVHFDGMHFRDDIAFRALKSGLE